MSTNLEWWPATTNGKDLPISLKWAMRKRCDGHVDGTFDYQDIGYFEGLRDADVDGAQEVIDAIEKHGSIVVREV